jgi:hypothetical protein
MTTATLKQTFIHTQALTTLFLGMLVTLGLLYMYFVSVAVVEVVVRTEVHRDIQTIASEISTLESAYIQAQHRVSTDIATQSGYKKSSAKTFIHRGGDSLVLKTASVQP